MAISDNTLGVRFYFLTVNKLKKCHKHWWLSSVTKREQVYWQREQGRGHGALHHQREAAPHTLHHTHHHQAAQPSPNILNQSFTQSCIDFSSFFVLNKNSRSWFEPLYRSKTYSIPTHWPVDGCLIKVYDMLIKKRFSVFLSHFVPISIQSLEKILIRAKKNFFKNSIWV